eukprot:gene31779-41245_t
MDSDLEASIDLMESSILGFHSKLDSMSEEMTSLSDRLADEQHRNRVLESDLTQSAGQVTSLQEKMASDGAVLQQYVMDMLRLVNLTQTEESSQNDDSFALLSTLQAAVGTIMSSRHDLSLKVEELLVSYNNEKALSEQKTAEIEHIQSKYADDLKAATSNNADITALSQSLAEKEESIAAMAAENEILRQRIEEIADANKKELLAQQQMLSAQLQEKGDFIQAMKEKVQATVTSYKKDIQDLTLAAAESEKEKSSIETLKAKWQSYQSEMESLKDRLGQTEKESAQRAAELAAQRHRDLETIYKKLSADADRLADENKQLKVECKHANNALINLESEKLHASAECSQLLEVISDVRNELAESLTARSSLEEALKAIEMDRNGLRLTNEDLLVNELMAEIDLLNGAKNALSQDKSSLQTQIATITDINKQTNKARAFLDNLTSENKGLQAKIAELEGTLADTLAAKNAIQHNRAVLEDSLHKNKEKYTEDLRQKETEMRNLEATYLSNLRDKVRIEESVKEMEAHKSLERAHVDGDEIKSKVQFILVPMVYDQITTLQTLLTTVESVSNMMFSSSSFATYIGGGKIDSLKSSKRSTVKDISTYSLLNRDGAQELSDHNRSFGGPFVRNAMFSPATHGQGAGGTGKGVLSSRGSGGTQCSSIIDALTQVEHLSQELERQQSGLILLTQSMEKLSESARQAQQSSLFSCCTSSFSFLGLQALPVSDSGAESPKSQSS